MNRLQDMPRYAVNCSILFTELPLLERPAAAKAAGFDAVEFWWPFAEPVPGDAVVDAFVAVVEDAGVQLVGLNFFAGDMPGGTGGWCPGRRAPTSSGTTSRSWLDIGERLGCRTFNALYGNRVDGVDRRQQDDLAAENLALAATGGVAAIDGTVLVEPVSGAPRYPLLTAADAVDVIDRVIRESGAENLGLLADLYHLAVNDDDVDKVIATYADRVATYRSPMRPGATSPAPATLPIAAGSDDLGSEGYDGWVGLEYKPSMSSVDSFGWVSRA